MPHPAERHYFQAWPEESPWRGSLPHVSTRGRVEHSSQLCVTLHTTRPPLLQPPCPQMPPFSLPLQQLAVRLLDGQLPNVGE